MVVLSVTKAKRHIRSLEDISKRSALIRVLADGADWCYVDGEIVQGPIAGRHSGVDGLIVVRRDNGEFIPRPDTRGCFYNYGSLVTVHVFLEKCRQLRIEYEKQQELNQKDFQWCKATATRFRKVGFNVTLKGSSVVFETQEDVETLLEVVEGA